MEQKLCDDCRQRIIQIEKDLSKYIVFKHSNFGPLHLRGYLLAMLCGNPLHCHHEEKIDERKES